MTIIPTSISSVAVYPDRARVTRQGEAKDLMPGVQRLEIIELPLRLAADSVRAVARGTSRARLLGVQLQREFFSEAPAEQVRQLEAQVEALQDELRSLDSQAELIQQNRAALENLAKQTKIYATALASGEMTLEAALSFFKGLRLSSNDLDKESQELSAHRRERERELQKLQKELDEQRSARPRERYTAAIEVEVLEAGDLSVDLTYVISGAGWQPLYDLRLLEDDGKPAMLDLGYLAQISQNTGEDWEDVALSLSTARPALAERIPELDPWYIAPFRPPQPAASAAGPQVMRAALAPAPEAADYLKAEARMPKVIEAEVSQAHVEASGSVVTYHVPGTVSIPSDRQPHKVTITRFSLPPVLDYVTAPRLVQAVYRRATVINDSHYTLMPGQANLFAGEEFIGSTRMELTSPQGEIELYLGVDDRIKVERELKRREVDKRLLGGRRRLVYGYETCLENHLESPAIVSLHDQVPVPRHEEIKVKLDSSDPRPSETDELGQLTWKLTLQPGQEQTVRFDFSVEYPQAMEVSGLP